MAEEIARLGYKVDTTPLKKAETSLKNVTKAGKKTETQTGKMSDKFKSFGKNASAAVASVDGPLGGVASRISSLTTVATSGTAAVTLLAAAVTALGAAAVYGLKELDSLNIQLAKTEALISATGGTAGKTANDLAEQAQEIAYSTLASVEGISKAQSVMLTFRSVTGDTFDQAIGLAQDMATVFGGDASSAATQLGKALNDPVRGVSQLARSGVTFTDQQKEQIKVLTESGELLQAQTLIIDELQSQFGGVAEAIAQNSLAGSMDTWGQSFATLTAQAVENVGLMGKVVGTINGMSAAMQQWTEDIQPDTASEAFEKALELLWDIAEAEEYLTTVTDKRARNAIKTRIAAMKKEREELLDYAKVTAEKENQISKDREEAALLAIELREAEAAAAKKAAEELAAAKIEAKYEAQSAALVTLSDKIGMTSDEMFIYNAMQKAAANEYTPEQTKAILEQAEAYIANKNAYESFQDSFGGQTEIGDDSFYDSLSFDEVNEVDNPFGQVTSGANEALGAIRTLSTEGSSEYASLGVAAQAVNTIQAIGAVLNQGSGDPYTAFGRMAAMATAVAALGVSVGSMSTGFDDESATNQAAQGLNVWGEKSESISNALETTADATSDLVGINTSMLDALTTLQDDLTSAAQLSLSDGLLDGADVSGSIIDNVYDLGSITGSGFVSAFEDSLKLLDFTTSLGITGWVTDWMGESLGGDSKVVDQGITLLGGTLSELIDGAVVEAYSKVDYTTWKFGSTKTKTLTEELDEASTQFALVFASLADSVSEGASTLGMSTADIAAALSEFEIETQKISLKGLSAEEQEEEIESVFSSIFDDLAGSVVPYLDDFQAVGESLGETLARVATEVAIADVLVNQLGVTLGDKLADPEAYTTIADNISTLVGGVEELASQTSDFVSSFAPESVMLEIYTDAMVEALDAIGLSLPDSTTGFWELMEGIDGTTEAGQEQIATLLSLTDTASEYYDLLEDNNDTFNSLTESLRDMVISMYDLDEATNTATLDMALAAARAGDFSLAEEFSGVTLSESDYGSAAEYAAATAVTANKIADLADLTESQVSIDERQVNLLDSINQNIIAGLTSLKDDLGGLMRTQNRIQAQAADSLDVINNKTEYAS